MSLRAMPARRASSATLRTTSSPKAQSTTTRPKRVVAILASASTAVSTMATSAPPSLRRRAMNGASKGDCASTRLRSPENPRSPTGGGAASGIGRLTRKTAPAPTVLSTAISPCIRSTMRRVMARPRPVPP